METDLKANDLAKMSQVQLIDEIISIMEEKKLSEESITAAKPYFTELARRNNISDDAAMLFAAFFNYFADSRT